jgi:uncharacterized protein YpmS
MITFLIVCGLLIVGVVSVILYLTKPDPQQDVLDEITRSERSQQVFTAIKGGRR